MNLCFFLVSCYQFPTIPDRIIHVKYKHVQLLNIITSWTILANYSLNSSKCEAFFSLFLNQYDIPEIYLKFHFVVEQKYTY